VPIWRYSVDGHDPTANVRLLHSTTTRSLPRSALRFGHSPRSVMSRPIGPVQAICGLHSVPGAQSDRATLGARASVPSGIILSGEQSDDGSLLARDDPANLA
jgi:hypothetical protein